jgi:hypothetical protein
MTINVMPLLNYNEVDEELLAPWSDGNINPYYNGLYLREFDEGIAVSEFHHGVWLHDEFFPSDIQDAR